MMTPKSINPSVHTKGGSQPRLPHGYGRGGREKKGNGMKWRREKEKETERRDLLPGI